MPRNNRWLDLSANLKGFGSASGWVAFITMGDPGGLKFGEARRSHGTMTAVAADGEELHVDIPARSFPSSENR